MAKAQHPFYYTIHDDNGLPSNEVYQLYQDEFGYMWIGCNAGLFRYDGFSFHAFRNIGQNSVAVSGLTAAPGQRLYCQNFSGQIFYASNDSLVLASDLKDRTRYHPAYSVDKDGNVWIGLPEGLLKHGVGGKDELLFRNELRVIEIRATDDGSLYAHDISRGLLKIFKERSGAYAWKKIPGVPEAFFGSRTIIEKQGDRYFALSSQNMARSYFITEIADDSARLIKAIPKNGIAEFIYSLTYSGDKLWLGTSEGAYRMDLQGRMEGKYFPSEKISDILVDREGNYWFSSLQNGLFVVPDMGLISLTAANSPLADNNVTCLKAIAPGKLLIGTYSGDIYSYEPASGLIAQLPKSKSANYGNVTTIIPYDKNTIIAGRGGVSVISATSHDDEYHVSVYIRDMLRKGDSLMYVSSEKVGFIGPLSTLVKGRRYITHDIKAIAGKKLCFDETGQTTWVTLNNGLAIFENGDFTQFTINDAPVFCNVLYANDRGLWAGTVSDGVYNIQNRKMVQHLGSRNGLLGSNVRSIISAHDTMYIATDVCINVCYPGGKVAYLDYTDGINAKEITSLALMGGHLFIGSIRGLFDLPVSTKLTNTVPPNIRITSVHTDGEPRNIADPLQLAWNSKDMLISFSSVALRSRGRFSYLYRISGFQNEWKKLDGNINYVRLNHLPSGNFTFEVKAQNEDGVMSAETASFTIVANAPFWQHWWFYVLLAIAAGSVVSLLFLRRIKKIKYNAHIRGQVATSQLTALKAQMNPHFMYNTLNSIQDLILQHDIKSTNYYLSRYSTLMRKILESSESNEIELNEEIEILQLYMELEKLRFGSDFTYTVTVSGRADDAAAIPSMIIQPFVENAVKHGLLHKKGAKRLEVNFEGTEGMLVCTIKDNGVGRKKAAEIRARSPVGHKSFATRATEKRLELINLNRKHKIVLTINDLEENGLPAGTEVRLEIPLIAVFAPGDSR